MGVNKAEGKTRDEISTSERQQSSFVELNHDRPWHELVRGKFNAEKELKKQDFQKNLRKIPKDK